MCSLSPAYRFQYPAKYTNFKYHQISFERCTGGIPNPIVITDQPLVMDEAKNKLEIMQKVSLTPPPG